MSDNLEVGKVNKVVEAGNENNSLTFAKTFTPSELLRSSIQALLYILGLGTTAVAVYLALREKPVKVNMEWLKKAITDTNANVNQLSAKQDEFLKELGQLKLDVVEVDHLKVLCAEAKAKQETILKELSQLNANVAVNSNTLEMMRFMLPMTPTPPGNGDGNGRKGGVDGPPKLLQSSIIPPPNQVWKMAGRALLNVRRLLKR